MPSAPVRLLDNAASPLGETQAPHTEDCRSREHDMADVTIKRGHSDTEGTVLPNSDSEVSFLKSWFAEAASTVVKPGTSIRSIEHDETSAAVQAADVTELMTSVKKSHGRSEALQGPSVITPRFKKEHPCTDAASQSRGKLPCCSESRMHESPPTCSPATVTATTSRRKTIGGAATPISRLLRSALSPTDGPLQTRRR
jgi:uncharacterized Zn ribbon protein